MEPIPFIDLKANFAPIRSQVLAAVERVFDDQSFILGPAVTRLEADLASMMGMCPESVIAVSSGTDALLVSMMALGIGPGDQVLTTPFSFFATAGTITRVGARPVFIDIDPESMNLDVRLLERLDPREFKAIIPVHLFGRLVDMPKLNEWAKSAQVPVIEDACQAIGARDLEGRSAGTLGTMGCFSFFPTKNLGGAGDGGCVSVPDPELAERVRVLRVHGAPKTYENTLIGGNFRLDALQAAVLSAKIPYLGEWTRLRLENAAAYDREFKSCGLDRVLGLPKLPGTEEFIAHQYVIRSPQRDALKHFLDSRKIGSAIYYPQPFHRMEAFHYLGYGPGAFPEAEAAAASVLALPIFPELGFERIRAIVKAIAEFHS